MEDMQEFAKAGAEEYGRTTFEAHNIEFRLFGPRGRRLLPVSATEIIVSLVMFSAPPNASRRVYSTLS